MKKIIVVGVLFLYVFNACGASWADVVKNGTVRTCTVDDQMVVPDTKPIPFALPTDVIAFDRAHALIRLPDVQANEKGKELFQELIQDPYTNPFLRLPARINIASYNLSRGIDHEQTAAVLLPILSLRNDAGIDPDILHRWQIRASELGADAYTSMQEKEKALISLCNALAIAHNNDLCIETESGKVFPAHSPQTVMTLVSLLRDPSLNKRFAAWLKASIATQREQVTFENELFALAERYGSNDPLFIRVNRAFAKKEYQEALALCEKNAFVGNPEDLEVIKNHWLSLLSTVKDASRFEAAYGLSLCEKDAKKAEVYLMMAAGKGVKAAQVKIYASAQLEPDEVKKERLLKILADGGHGQASWDFAQSCIARQDCVSAEPYIVKAAEKGIAGAELKYAARGENTQDHINRFEELAKRKNFALHNHAMHALGLAYKASSDLHCSKNSKLNKSLARKHFDCSIKCLEEGLAEHFAPSIITLSTIYLETVQYKQLSPQKQQMYLKKIQSMLHDLIEREPHNAKAWINMSAYHLANKDKQSAVGTFVEAFRVSINVDYEMRAIVLHAIENFSTALMGEDDHSFMKVLAMRMLEVQPEYYGALMTLGRLALDFEHDRQKALDYYERAGAQNFLSGWHIAAQLYHGDSDVPADPAKVRDCLLKCLLIDPKRTDIWDELAKVYGSLHDDISARNAWHSGAALGDVDCILESADCNRTGYGGAYDPVTAVGLYQKAEKIYNKQGPDERARLCAFFAAVTANQASPADSDSTFAERVSDFAFVEQELLRLSEYEKEFAKEVFLALGLRCAALSQAADCPFDEYTKYAKKAKLYFWQTLDDRDPRGLYHLVVHTMTMFEKTRGISEEKDRSTLRYARKSLKKIINCFEEQKMFNNAFLICAYIQLGKLYLAHFDHLSDEGRNLFMKAAQRSSPCGCYNLGCYYQNMSYPDASLEQAQYWLEKAIEYAPDFDIAKEGLVCLKQKMQ